MSKSPRKEWRHYNGASAETFETIYADDVKITASGDLVFHTYLDSGKKLPNSEEVAYEINASLIIPAGQWGRLVQQMNGEALYALSDSYKLQVSQAA